jgi:hypothetical protein
MAAATAAEEAAAIKDRKAAALAAAAPRVSEQWRALVEAGRTLPELPSALLPLVHSQMPARAANTAAASRAQKARFAAPSDVVTSQWLALVDLRRSVPEASHASLALLHPRLPARHAAAFLAPNATAPRPGLAAAASQRWRTLTEAGRTVSELPRAWLALVRSQLPARAAATARVRVINVTAELPAEVTAEAWRVLAGRGRAVFEVPRTLLSLLRSSPSTRHPAGAGASGLGEEVPAARVRELWRELSDAGYAVFEMPRAWLPMVQAQMSARRANEAQVQRLPVSEMSRQWRELSDVGRKVFEVPRPMLPLLA